MQHIGVLFHCGSSAGLTAESRDLIRAVAGDTGPSPPIRTVYIIPLRCFDRRAWEQLRRQTTQELADTGLEFHFYDSDTAQKAAAASPTGRLTWCDSQSAVAMLQSREVARRKRCIVVHWLLSTSACAQLGTLTCLASDDLDLRVPIRLYQLYAHAPPLPAAGVPPLPREVVVKAVHVEDSNGRRRPEATRKRLAEPMERTGPHARKHAQLQQHEGPAGGPPLAQVLIVVAGGPCSGKTTLAHGVAVAIGGMHLSIGDAYRAGCEDRLPHWPVPYANPTKEHWTWYEARLHDLLCVFAHDHPDTPLVVDGPTLDTLDDTMLAAGRPITQLITLRCDEDTMISRMAARARPGETAAHIQEKRVQKYCKRAYHHSAGMRAFARRHPAATVLELDGNQPVNDVLTEALRRLRLPHPAKEPGTTITPERLLEMLRSVVRLSPFAEPPFWERPEAFGDSSSSTGNTSASASASYDDSLPLPDAPAAGTEFPAYSPTSPSYQMSALSPEHEAAGTAVAEIGS